MLEKSTVTLGGIPLAATTGFIWRFVGGVGPYVTSAEFYRKERDNLSGYIGQPLDLIIRDSRGKKVTVREVYILHEQPSTSANRVVYTLADKRWKWQYELVARDYNIPRKTGDKTALGVALPRQAGTIPQNDTIVDKYDYLTYSLDEQGLRWTAEKALEDVLEQLVQDNYRIESFPIGENGSVRGFTLQNVTLRDAGDVALARLLSNIPGTDIYVDKDGVVVVRDSSDLQKTEDHLAKLESQDRLHVTGDYPAWVDRKGIRPSRVFVYYQREVEVYFEYEDNYSGQTAATPNRDAPYIENVMPTVDPLTTVTDFDPEPGQLVTKEDALPGTWADARQLLKAWDDSTALYSYTFDNLAVNWVHGDVPGVLGATGSDVTDDAIYIATSARVAAIQSHWRQTFRINRRFTERVRDMLNVRAALLDPVTAARQPAGVWAQTCALPTNKSLHIAKRGPGGANDKKYYVYRNLDYFHTADTTGEEVFNTTPAPATMQFIDKETGVFRVQWVQDPYGIEGAYTPGMTVANDGAARVVSRNLAVQDNGTVAAGALVESAGTIRLSPRMRLAVVFTMVPAAPNNRNQFHREEVSADEVASLFKGDPRLTGGRGPDLHVFIPPGELTARFAMNDLLEADETIRRLLGLDGSEGITEPELPGYTHVNRERAIRPHALSVAAEIMTDFADGAEGDVVTTLGNEVKVVGNMDAAAVRVATSGKVDVQHSFPGRQRKLSRMALLPEPARRIIYGYLESN